MQVAGIKGMHFMVTLFLTISICLYPYPSISKEFACYALVEKTILENGNNLVKCFNEESELVSKLENSESNRLSILTRFKPSVGKFLRVTYYDDNIVSQYRWHDNGAIFVSCEYAPFKPKGKCINRFEDGSVSFDREYDEDGLLVGLVSRYYKNGSLIFSAEYDHGQFHGNKKEWSCDGELVKHERYESGALIEVLFQHDSKESCTSLIERGDI
ncbi:toxin-antitoxin system YwqK family antitoxin [Corallincola spongiicola]|uniref:Toxin-antitoxin system YwqK family antitoxin n=1 Tax=Corallincola spongiicola TaxID=2520508 RepID=A0ABY1WRQ9_9GAMM|nr:hypothetical protein [Corallincola spongiicola]TAA47430.1 hypothetical protein EXY25_09400 [Corallincola spongiicola]